MQHRFDIKVIGFIEIKAKNEEEALDKFNNLMDNGYKISDLRWKYVEAEKLDD